RFRDLKLVKFFNELGDVPPWDRFDEMDPSKPPFPPDDTTYPVVWGVAYDALNDRQYWAPVELETGGGGGGGEPAAAGSLRGGSSGWPTLEYSYTYGSDPFTAPNDEGSSELI